jgi:PKD repeat protein
MRIFLVISIFLFHFTWCYSQTWSTLGGMPAGAGGFLLKDTINNRLYVGGKYVWDGTNWDSLGTGMNATVHTLAMYNGELYAGGDFTVADGNATNYIAKWNGINWIPVGIGMDEAVFSLTVYNGELYAGGNFTMAGGTSANYIAKWDGVTWSSVGTGVDDMVFTILEYNGKLYTGGWFTNAGGNPANYIASWDGSTWSPIGLGTNSSVRTLGIYNGKLYLGGLFTMADGTPFNRIASWDGSVFDSLSIGVNNTVNTITSYNCELYVGGQFTSAGGNAANCIAKWNGIGWSPLGSGISAASVNSLSEYNGDLYVGGTIFPIGTNIKKWNISIPPPPTASFFTNDLNIQMGSYIQFTNTSTVGATASWIFQGGVPASSTALNPIVYYPTVGSYDVTLVTASCSGIDTLDKFSYINVDSSIHTVPYGNSWDRMPLYGGTKDVFYYKPLTYDSINSPILLAIHGQGSGGNPSDGASPRADLIDIADRRNALIVAPNMSGLWWMGLEAVADSNMGCKAWVPLILKEIYKHILTRENRDSIPVYLTGFSAGGQFVTRYMLIRQGILDSIPIKMAVSANAYFYTFCTDTLNGESMVYSCGLDSGSGISSNCENTIFTPLEFDCNEHVIQYYNENYAILIGVADSTGAPALWSCMQAQGNNRYERAQNFYAFSDSDAVNRGTTLKWQYGEVPGVAHDQNLMYNTILAGDSMPLAERLLFETPYHTVPNLVPLANFTTDTTIVNLPSATVQFYNNSTNTTDYLWDFGDTTTSTIVNPSHTYTYADTFTVKLTASSGSGCADELIKQNYIIVNLPTGVKSYHDDNSFQVFPNPATETVTFNYQLSNTMTTASIHIYDAMGRKIKSLAIDKNSNSYVLNISPFSKGFYLVTLISNNEIKANKKLFIVK